MQFKIKADVDLKSLTRNFNIRTFKINENLFKQGVLDKEGYIVILPQWDKVLEFYNDNYFVVGNIIDKHYKYGVINVYNQLCVPLEYDSISDIHNSEFLIVKKGNYYGVIDYNNNVKIEIKHLYLKHCGGIGDYFKNENQEIIDTNNNIHKSKFYSKKSLVKEYFIPKKEYYVLNNLSDNNDDFILIVEQLNAIEKDSLFDKMNDYLVGINHLGTLVLKDDLMLNVEEDFRGWHIAYYRIHDIFSFYIKNDAGFVHFILTEKNVLNCNTIQGFMLFLLKDILSNERFEEVKENVYKKINS